LPAKLRLVRQKKIIGELIPAETVVCRVNEEIVLCASEKTETLHAESSSTWSVSDGEMT
jgi:hypothetical protein